MINSTQLVAYLNSLEESNTPLLETIEANAIKQNVPIIKKETQALLKTLLLLSKPKSILEVGTAVGFSALLFAEYTPEECKITTIENFPKRVLEAAENFKKASAESRIELLEGDAKDILVILSEVQKEQYDFIFLDAAKGQYPIYFPYLLHMLLPGGVLVSDNVLQDGDIAEPREAIVRRQRTIHKRMRQYLYDLKHHKELETAILAIGDGVAVSVKK